MDFMQQMLSSAIRNPYASECEMKYFDSERLNVRVQSCGGRAVQPRPGTSATPSIVCCRETRCRRSAAASQHQPSPPSTLTSSEVNHKYRR